MNNSVHRLRRFVLIGLAILVVALGALGWIRSRPRAPIVPDLFTAIEGTISIPDDENAYAYYRRANDLYKGTDFFPTTLLTDDSAITPSERDALSQNAKALKVWFEGTEKTRSLFISPHLGQGRGNAIYEMRIIALSRLAQLHAYDLRKSGNLAEAWRWLRAGLRSSRHQGTYGCYDTERVMGIFNYHWSAKEAYLWADDPRVDASLLRHALDDVIELNKLTPSGRGTILGTYFGLMSSLDDPAMHRAARSVFYPKVSENHIPWRVDQAVLTLCGEPERSRRIARLLLTNWLAIADAPRAERTRRLLKVGAYTVFNGAEGSPTHFDAETFENWLKSSAFLDSYLQMWSRWHGLLSQDETTRADLVLHLAEQLYIREKGKLPARPEDLVPLYLKALPEYFTEPAGSN